MDATNLLMRRLGANVRRLRDRAGWSQQGLADRVGIHVMSVGRHENGKHPMGILEAVAYADALSITLDALVGRATDCLAQMSRSDVVYVIDRQAVETILGAKRISQIRPLWVEGYRWDVQVQPDNEVVSRAVWEATKQSLDAHMRKLR